MADLPSDNPFARPSTLPFQLPPFDRIHDTDYLPAFEAGMRAQRDEVTQIAQARNAPTFENTLVALERSGELLERVLQPQCFQHQSADAEDRVRDRAAIAVA